MPGDDEVKARYAAFNDQARQFSLRALELAVAKRGAIDGTDNSVSDKFNFMLWRLARMSDQRASYLARQDNAAGASADRDLAHRLDKANSAVRLHSQKLERVKPVEGVVLTPREGLFVALRRADFDLAVIYANMVRRVDPTDADANFALGMNSLEMREFARASLYLEAALKKRPDEPAILNNLALAYLKQGDFKQALKHAERASALVPYSEDVKRNLRDIRKAAEKKPQELPRAEK